MTPDDVIEHARASVGKGIRYRLGRGKIDPSAPTPAFHDGFCDCSGFVCWALGIAKQGHGQQRMEPHRQEKRPYWYLGVGLFEFL